MNLSRPLRSLREFLSVYATTLTSAGGVTAYFAIQQVIRLAGSITLAWLLAPEMLGTMMLLNTLRTAGELLSDVGVGQGIVQNPKGNDPDYYNTAWTVNILRGIILCVFAIFMSNFIANIYSDKYLSNLIIASSMIFILSGFTSPGRSLLVKRMDVTRLARFDLILALVWLPVQLILAYVMRDTWSLVVGLLINQLLSTVLSFFMIRGLKYRLMINRPAAIDIISFGKWIFLSSIIYFLSLNFDRLYLANAIPFVLFGLYGVARTYSDTAIQLFGMLGSYILFPRISAVHAKGGSVKFSLAPVRPWLLAAIAVALAGGVTLADLLISLIYDDRYTQAGPLLALFLFSTWFAGLAAVADFLLMGIGKPAGTALANLVKLISIAVLVPILLSKYGLFAAIGAMMAAEILRYLSLVIASRREGVSFIRQDVGFTLFFIALCLIFREATGMLHLTSGLAGWQQQLGL